MVATATLELVMKLVGRSEKTMMSVGGSDVPGGGLAPLHAWLGQELESRGIDAVVYTRYILSILQQDPAFVGDDLDLAADNHFFPPSSGRRDGGVRSSRPGAQRVPAGRKLPDKVRRPVDVADCEERKKSAAVECLLSVSEEDCGIESLVDELCLKLKEQQAHHTDSGSGGTSQSDTAGSSDSDSSECSGDPAQRYYAAFPALTTEAQTSSTSTTTSVSLLQEGGVWAAKVTQGLARSDGLVEPARRAAVTWRLTPSPISNHREIREADRVRGRLDGYRAQWQCRCKGRYSERQKTSRYCAACESGNNKGRNRENTVPKQNGKSVRGINRGTEKSDEEVCLSLSPHTKIPTRSTKAWKDYEYMRPIFIVPKVHSPDLNTTRVRSVRTNQKTESVLDFFFKSRVALGSPLLDQMCYCGAESIWGCTAGCLNWPEMLGLGADSEDQSWYTEPLDMMVKPSPIPSRRLYNRCSVFGSFSNLAFFENKLHVFEEALSDEDPQSLDSLGLSSLLSRTLEHCAYNAYLSDPDVFDTISIGGLEATDAGEEENTKVIVEESNIENNEIQLVEKSDNKENAEMHLSEKCKENDDAEFNDQDSIKDEISFDSEEGVDDDDEVAYPSHIRPVILPSTGKETENNEDDDHTLGNPSPGESPESQLQWDVSESVLRVFCSDSDTQTTQATGPEAIWDRPALLTSSHSDVFCSDSNTQTTQTTGPEAIWDRPALLTSSHSDVFHSNSDTQTSQATGPEAIWDRPALLTSSHSDVFHSDSDTQTTQTTGPEAIWDRPALLTSSHSDVFRSDSDTNTTQATGPEAIWDQPALPTSSHSESHLDGLSAHVGTIWGCGELTPPPSIDLLSVGVGSTSTWGFSSSSSDINSKSASHASSQDNLYDGTGEPEYFIRDDPCTACGQPPAPLSGGYRLGSRVWETTRLSPGSGKPGRIPTPNSTENQVLDDRPLFYLPLEDDDFHMKHSLGCDVDADTPLPIPPLEFDFSDSEDDLIIHPAASNVHLHHSQSPTQTHPHHQPHQLLSPTPLSHAPHSHSCISSVHHNHHHVDSWKDQNDANSRSAIQEADNAQQGVGAPETGACAGCGGITASLTCDTLGSSSSKSPRAALPHHDILLTTSIPLLDTSSIWSYCLESLLSPRSASEHSLFVSPFTEEWPNSELFCTLPLSPKHEGSDLSHLWDINAVHRCHVCEWTSDKLAVGVETQNIRRYLMDLRFDPSSTHPDSTCTIFDGGLYGSLLTSGSWSVWGSATPTWSLWKDKTVKDGRATPTACGDTMPYDNSHPEQQQQQQSLEGAKLWKNFDAKPHFFRQRSTSADHTEGMEQGFSGGHLSGSMSLLPSENSAFSDQIPPRVSLLPHVQSEPALVRQQPAHGRVYNHGRLVQVRSLYKSDVNVLHQLGLVSDNEDDPEAEVEVLPHTHFVPITDDTEAYLSGEGALTSTPKPAAKPEAVKRTMERIPTPLGPVPEVCPVLGRESSYQLYYHPEGPDEDEEGSEFFVPRFQVQKGTEKCCQTGDKEHVVSGTPEGVAQRRAAELEVIEEMETSSETESVEPVEPAAPAAPPSVENTSHQEALGMFLYDMQDVLELSVEDAERFMSNADTPPANLLPNNVANQDEVDYSSDYESMGAEQVSIEELGRAGIAELWDGEEDGAADQPDSAAKTPVLSSPVAILPAARAIASNSGSTSSAGGHYRSIWSWGAEPDLPSLPNSYASEHSFPMSQQQGGAVDKLPKWSQGTNGVPLLRGEEETEGAMAPDTLDPEWLVDSDDVFIDDPEVQMQLFGVDPNPEPDQVIFSQDLEQHWLNTHSSFTVQVPNPGHYKLSYHKKPCSFFLEGNCRRTDCKFAHDISNITCRFWEESTCFKGVTCPFLHGYPGESDGDESQRSSSERDFELGQEEFPELSQQQVKETGSGKPIGSHGIRRRGSAARKVEDRTRASFTSEVDHRRRSRQRAPALTHGSKHMSGKGGSNHTEKDEKKDDVVPVNDVG